LQLILFVFSSCKISQFLRYIIYRLSFPYFKEFSLPCYGNSIQINSTDIYIFGGKGHENNIPQTYLFRIRENTYTLHKCRTSLPILGSSWSNPVLFENKIFCLQNIELEKSETFILGRKRIFGFFQNSWHNLNNEL